MAEPKPLASLTSSLLARKGAARPAMRRQAMGTVTHGSAVTHDDLGWNDMGYDVDPTTDNAPTSSIDLKPMMPGAIAAVDHRHGDDVDPALVAKPAVVQQREELAERVAMPPAPEPVAVVTAPSVPTPRPAPVVAAPVAAPAPVVAPAPAPASAPAATRRPRAAAARKSKAAFTLRLDTDRHLRLRLASAISNRSSQTILIELLDDYLASLPEIDVMANRATSAH